MRVFPDKPIERVKLLVFPLKVYVVVAPILFLISSQAPRPQHYGATEAEIYIVIGLIAADLVLLLAAIAFALHGPRRVALPCLWFALAGILIAILLLPTLPTAKTRVARANDHTQRKPRLLWVCTSLKWRGAAGVERSVLV